MGKQTTADINSLTKLFSKIKPCNTQRQTELNGAWVFQGKCFEQKDGYPVLNQLIFKSRRSFKVESSNSAIKLILPQQFLFLHPGVLGLPP